MKAKTTRYSVLVTRTETQTVRIEVDAAGFSQAKAAAIEKAANMDFNDVSPDPSPTYQATDVRTLHPELKAT